MTQNTHKMLRRTRLVALVTTHGYREQYASFVCTIAKGGLVEGIIRMKMQLHATLFVPQNLQETEC